MPNTVIMLLIGYFWSVLVDVKM